MKFSSDETGAVTVDWVVLTAALVGLGLAAMNVVSGGVSNLSTDIETEFKRDDIIKTAFPTTPDNAPSWYQEGHPLLGLETGALTFCAGRTQGLLASDAISGTNHHANAAMFCSSGENYIFGMDEATTRSTYNTYKSLEAHNLSLVARFEGWENTDQSVEALAAMVGTDVTSMQNTLATTYANDPQVYIDNNVGAAVTGLGYLRMTMDHAAAEGWTL